MKDARFKFSEIYLEDFLSKVPNRLERAKIKMIFWFSMSLSVFLLSYIPVLNSISTLLAAIGIFTILLLGMNIYFLKSRESYKLYAKFVLTFLLLSDLLFMCLVIPENLGGYLLGTIIMISLATFILGKNWTIGFTTVTILGSNGKDILQVN